MVQSSSRKRPGPDRTEPGGNVVALKDRVTESVYRNMEHPPTVTDPEIREAAQSIIDAIPRMMAFLIANMPASYAAKSTDRQKLFLANSVLSEYIRSLS